MAKKPRNAATAGERNAATEDRRPAPGPARDNPTAISARLDRWAELTDRTRLLFGRGFRDRNEQDEFVLLAPAG
jgi:hypothetical protein